MLNDIDKMVVRLSAMLAAYDANVNTLSTANQQLTNENAILKGKLEDAQGQLMDADAKLAEIENQPEQMSNATVLALPKGSVMSPID